MNKKRRLKKRLWLKRRNEKNLRLRTKKKLAIKRRRHSIHEYNRSVKKETLYNPKTKEHVFTVPTDFSFISNVDETNDFFNELIGFITNRRNFGKRIFVDVSKTQHLTIDALMYLLAIMNNLNDAFNNKYMISGNAPINESVRKMFEESGFYDYVRHSKNILLENSTDSIRIVTGNDSNTQIAKQITEFVMDIAGISRVQTTFIYIMLIEMMSNTYKHAYSDNKILLPQWYCYVKYDKNGFINFTFMDTGEGIASTVNKRFGEKIDILRIKGDEKYIISALNGEFRSETKLQKHGKGLPRIRKCCTDGKIENMRILANKANVTVKSDNYDSKVLNNSFMGTLYYWQININKLKGNINVDN